MNPQKAETIIKVASGWLFSIPGIPSSLKKYWVHILPILFSDWLSKERVILMALRKNKADEIAQDVATTSIALLQLAWERSKTEHDKGLAGLLEHLIQTKLDQLGVDLEEVVSLSKSYQKRIESEDNRIAIAIPSSINPLVFDHLARWVTIWLFWGNFEEWFWVINLLLIPIAVLGYAIIRTRKASAYNKLLIEVHGGQSFLKPVPSHNAMQYTILAVIVLVNIMATNILVAADEVGSAEMWAILIGMSIYFILYIRNLSIIKINEGQLVSRLHEVHKYGEHLSHDENDQVIIEVETKLRSIRSRLEAYVLESALFGALSFSGFLQIMAEELVSFKDLEDFATHSYSLFKSFLEPNWELMQQSAQSLSSKSDLFALISVESLVCSILFLAVIASRLRVNDIIDRMTRHLDLARAFNVKEENLVHKQGQSALDQENLSSYNQHIFDNLLACEQGLIEIAPSTSYMRYFRNAGIFTFLIILISSALFISGFLSWVFAVAGILSIVYFNRKEIVQKLSDLLVWIRWMFIRRGFVFLLGSIASMIVGFMLRTQFKFEWTDPFIATGFSLLGVFLFVWIVLIPHHDSKFQSQYNIESKSWWETLRFFWGLGSLMVAIAFLFVFLDWQGAWAIMGISLTSIAAIIVMVAPRMVTPKWAGMIGGIAIAAMIVGIMFKAFSLPGAAALAGLGITVVAILNLFLQIRVVRPVQMGIVRGVGGSASLMAMLFKFLHLPGAGEMLILGIIMMVITLAWSVIGKSWQEPIHHMFVKSFLFITMISISAVLPGGFGERGYEHYTFDQSALGRIESLSRSIDVISRNLDDELDLDARGVNLDEVFELLDWYDEFSKSLPLPDDRRKLIQKMYSIANRLYEQSTNRDDLTIGYQLVTTANEMTLKNPHHFALLSINWRYDEKENVPLLLGSLEPLFLEKLDKPNEAEHARKRLFKDFDFKDQPIDPDIVRKIDLQKQWEKELQIEN
ncbi:MAG: hypothetical protein JXQ90_17500 [Cyclobacteriaceae bacterium]